MSEIFAVLDNTQDIVSIFETPAISASMNTPSLSFVPGPNNVNTAVLDNTQDIVSLFETPAISASMNVPTLSYLSEFSDVDIPVLENGSILVYVSATNKWTSTRTLEEQNLEGGHY